MEVIEAVVSRGKIEIQAPDTFSEGERVSVMVLEHQNSEEFLTAEEIVRVLKILDDFCKLS